MGVGVREHLVGVQHLVETKVRGPDAHFPQDVMAGTRTRSPTASDVIAAPISVIVPIASCPSTRPGVTAGTSPLRMCRSVPQIVVVSTPTTTSVGSITRGSGTSVHAIEPGPSKTSAFTTTTAR